MGAIPAGAGGYAIGKGLEAAGTKYLLGDELPTDPGGSLGAVAGTVGEGLDASTQGEGLGKVLTPVGKAIASRLKDTAIGATIRHLRPTPTVSRGLGREGMKDVAQEALDSGAIRPFQKVGDTAENLSNLAQEAGAVKGDIVNASGAKINPLDVAQRFENEVISPLRGTAENESIVKALEGKKAAFLEKYASGYKEGGRAPGTPTTITRSSKFVPQEPTPIPQETGTYPTYMPGEIPKLATKKGMSAAQIEAAKAPRSVEQVRSTFHPDQVVSRDPLTGGGNFRREVHPVIGASTGPVENAETLAASLPFKTERGLPVKEVIRRRLEGVPNASMTPAQLEAEKVAVNNNINWKTEPSSSTGGKMGWSGVLKRSTEDVLQDSPAFLASKRAYGNLKEGTNMASRTAGLTDAGTGLMGHMGDVAAAHSGISSLLSGNPAGLAVPVARSLTKGRIASTIATGANAMSKGVQGMTDRFANPVANAIAQRVGQSQAPRGEQSHKTPAALHEDYVKQQTDHDAQDELKRSQE